MIPESINNFLSDAQSLQEDYFFIELIQLFKRNNAAVEAITLLAHKEKVKAENQVQELKNKVVPELEKAYSRIKSYRISINNPIPAINKKCKTKLTEFEAILNKKIISTQSLLLALNNLLFEYIDELYKAELPAIAIRKYIKRVAKTTRTGLRLKAKSFADLDALFSSLLNLKERYHLFNHQFNEELNKYPGLRASKRYQECTIILLAAFNSLLYGETHSSRHINFIKEFAIYNETGHHIIRYEFSKLFPKYFNEYDKCERKKLAEFWYAWDNIYLAVQLYCNFEDMKFPDPISQAEACEAYENLKRVAQGLPPTTGYASISDLKYYLTSLVKYLRSYYANLPHPHAISPDRANKKKSELSPGQWLINGDIISLSPQDRPHAILRVLFTDPTKKWSWDEVHERLDHSEPPKGVRAPKRKRQLTDSYRSLNQTVGKQSGGKTKKLLIYSANTVCINPEFRNSIKS